MKEFVEAVVNGRWFTGEKAPFKCQLTWDNPKLVFITGPNASGKSVLRKVLHNRAKDEKWMYVNTSQEGRISSSGLERLMVYGVETEDSTGYNSIRQITKCFSSIKSYEKPFLVMLDEPEIGCSEEVQAAMGKLIADEFEQFDNPNMQGFFVITHSRHVVRHAMPAKPSHWRLSDDNMTLDQYVNREVAPANLEDVLEVGKQTWHAVERLLRK